MNIHDLRRKFWQMRNDRKLNAEGVYVDTLHAVLDENGEALIGGEIWDGRERVFSYPDSGFKGLYTAKA